MIRTLQDKGVHMGVDVYMECTITKLLKDGDKISGAFGYWRENGKFIVFKAKSVVLATGGRAAISLPDADDIDFTRGSNG